MKFLTTANRSGGVAFGKALVIEEAVIHALKNGPDITSYTGEDALLVISIATEHVLAGLKKEAVRDIHALAEIAILQDPMIRGAIRHNLFDSKLDLFNALDTAMRQVCEMFNDNDGQLPKNKVLIVNDIRKVFGIIKSFLLEGSTLNPLADMPPGTVVVAKEIAKEVIACINLENMAGMVSEFCAEHDKLDIFAKNNGFISLTGLDNCVKAIRTGDSLIIDGNNGKVIINPDEKTLQGYLSEEKEFRLKRSVRLDYKNKHIKVYGQAGTTNEVRIAAEYGADGISQFRSEFSYINRIGSAPDEKTLSQSYATAASFCKKSYTIIRLLDTDSSSRLPYLQYPDEENPLLGLKGIRYLIKNEELLKTQIRAILRVPAYIRIGLSIPMVTTPEEVIKVKNIIKECSEELTRKNVRINQGLPVGVIAETPACVFNIEEIAELCDFIDIDTDSLAGYILAADKGEETIDISDPAVGKAIRQIVEGAHKHGTSVGAGGSPLRDPRHLDCLLEMGIDYFSVPGPEIPAMKEAILNKE